MYDTGFHLDLESNNADCGDLIDLMKPEREPSTILFFGNMTCQGQRFWGTTPLSGEYWLRYALVRGSVLVSQARKNVWDKRGENLGENWGEFRVKNFGVLAA